MCLLLELHVGYLPHHQTAQAEPCVTQQGPKLLLNAGRGFCLRLPALLPEGLQALQTMLMKQLTEGSFQQRQPQIVANSGAIVADSGAIVANSCAIVAR